MAENMTLKVVTAADLVEEIGHLPDHFPVSREYVDKALQQIERGEEDMSCYFDRIYELAVELENASATRN